MHSISGYDLSNKTNFLNIDRLYQYSKPLRLPSMCYQTLISSQESIPADLYKHILTKVGIMIISLAYTEETSSSLEKIVSFLGTPHTHNAKGDIIWHIKEGGVAGKDALARSHKLTGFSFHTDCSYEQHIPDYFALYCLRHDRLGGGKNLIIDCSTLIQHLTRESLETLQNKPVGISIPEEFKKGPSLIKATIIDKNFNFRYRKELLCEHLLSNSLRRALKEIDRLCYSPLLARSLELKDGHILILDNRRYLHARTSVKDEDRHLLRIRFFTKFN